MCEHDTKRENEATILSVINIAYLAQNFIFCNTCT